MKSLQELYDEVKGDDVLKKSFAEAMKKRGCGGLPEAAWLRGDIGGAQRVSREQGKGERSLKLSKDELASVSGGTSYYCGEPCSRGETSDRSDTCIRDCF